MPICNIGVGRYEEVANSSSLKSALSEFLATFIFVFAGEGSVLAYASLTSDASLSVAGLTSVALSHAFALFVAVAVAANISGGHVNPAVTFALFLSGHITLLKGILYWIAQLAGAVVASLLLSYITDGATISPPGLSSSVTVDRGLVSEIVLTFGLVYTVFTTAVDPRAKGNVSLLAPLAIGLVVGANIFFGGAFDGAAMNPARAFGPALVSWDFTNHWIYWVGPLVGGAIAAFIYEFLLVPHPHSHQPIPSSDDHI